MSEPLAREKVPEHVQAMEHALGLFHDVGRALVRAPRHALDRRPCARQVESAIVCTLDAYDLRRDPLSAVRDAITRADEARSELAGLVPGDAGLFELDGWVAKARGWLLVAERFFETHPRAPRAAVELVASGDVPTLHDPARGSLAPTFDVAEPLPAPTVVERPDLTALPPRERVPALRAHAVAQRKAAAERRDARALARKERMREKTIAERAVMAPGMIEGRFEAASLRTVRRDKARDLLQEISAMGAQRTPLLGDYWRGSSVFDLRMCRAVDALAALGPDAIEAIERVFMDAPAKDAPHVFGVCFALGCFAGRDTLAAVERIVRDIAAEDPALHDPVAIALKLAPTDVTPLLVPWTRDPDAGLRAIAVDALGHRGALTDEELLLLAEDEAERVAARALLHAARRKPAGLGAVLERRASPKTEELRSATAWATILGGTSFPMDRLRTRLDAGDVAHVALPFALAAEREDGQRLVELFKTAPTRSLVDALGFLGDPTTLPLLVSTLEQSDVAPEVRQSVAFALLRITGAELFEETLVDPATPDADDPADPPLPDAGGKRQPQAERRDPPGKGAPDVESLPTLDASRWREHLADEHVRYQGERRTRRGAPYTPEQSLDELANYQVTPAERLTLFRELVVKTGTEVHFDPVDFVAVQEATIARLEKVAARASSQPGAYGSRVSRAT